MAIDNYRFRAPRADYPNRRHHAVHPIAMTDEIGMSRRTVGLISSEKSGRRWGAGGQGTLPPLRDD